MTRTRKVYIGNCVGIGMRDLPKLQAMTDAGRLIGRSAFLRHVDSWSMRSIEQSLGYAIHHQPGLTMARDWHVAYYASTWGARPCVYFVHSAIEFIFVEPYRDGGSERAHFMMECQT